MPPDKIRKARTRLRDILAAQQVTRTKMNKTLGTLRHVITCIPMARAFIQRLCDLQRRAPPFGTTRITTAAKDDIRWLLVILECGQLHRIPLKRFATQVPATCHIQMDASNQGLCALYPDRKEYLQVRFDSEELAAIDKALRGGSSDFGINLRELLSTVFAALVWGQHWLPKSEDVMTHVIFLIDNTAAVAWNNKRFSRNPEAQLALRILALLEVRYRFYATAEHIAGVDYTAADAGSRVWESPEHAIMFSNLCCEWKQVEVPPHSRKLSAVWELYSAPEAWQPVQETPTLGHGVNGRCGA